MSEKIFTNIPAGTFFIGDPCYAFGAGKHKWDDILTATDTYDSSTVTEIEPGMVTGAFSIGGDGVFPGHNADTGASYEFPVDAGIIGFVDVRLMDEADIEECRSQNCGVFVTFEKSWSAFAEGDWLYIGNIRIEIASEDEWESSTDWEASTEDEDDY